MYWFLLIFILKVLALIHGAPIDVVEHIDDLPAGTNILESSIHQGFVVTERGNNIVKAAVDLREDEDKIENSFTTVESLNKNVSDNSQNFNFNETTLSPVNEKQTSAQILKLNQTLEALDSTLTQSLEGLKSVNNLGLHKISEDSQNSNINDNVDSTTILVRVDETREEFLKHRMTPVLNTLETIKSGVKQSVDAFTEGLKSLENFSLHQNSAENENVEAITLPSLDQSPEVTEQSNQSSDTLNSAVKQSVETFTEGFRSLENFSFNKNSQDLENFNINEYVETTGKSSVNLDQTSEESGESKTFETINSAIQKSVNTFNEGLKSLENFSLHQNSADFQNQTVSENVEATTLPNLDQISEGTEESNQISDTINSAAKQSVDTFTEGLKSLENISFNKNSQDLENFNISENVETAEKSSVNLDQISEESEESKTLETINSAVQQSVDPIMQGFKSLENFSFNKNSQDSENSNINENVETAEKSSVNLDLTSEGSEESKTLETINSAVQQSVDPITERFKSLENFSFNKNSQDSENVETAAKSSVNLHQTSEESEESKTSKTINSAVQQSVDPITEEFKSLENFSINKNSQDSENSITNENVETAGKSSVNLDQTSEESEDLKTLETINSAVQQSVDPLTEGFKSLENFSFNKNSQDLENVETAAKSSVNLDQTSEENAESKPLETVNYSVKHIDETYKEGLKSLENFSFHQNSADTQNLNINKNAETTTLGNLYQTAEANEQPKILENMNSAAQLSIETFTEDFKSAENLNFNKNSQDSATIESLVNLEQVPEDKLDSKLAEKISESKQIIDSINSAVKESVDTLNEDLKSLENFKFQQNSTDSQNSNVNGNVETTTTLVNPHEESLESKGTSEIKQSVDTLNEEYKGVTYGINQNSEDSQNIKEIIENSTANRNLNREQETSDLKTLESINSAVKQYVDTINEEYDALKNLSSEDSQNLEKVPQEIFSDTAAKGLQNYDHLNTNSVSSRNLNSNIKLINDLGTVDQNPEETFKHKETLGAINSEFNQSAVNFNEGMNIENSKTSENIHKDSKSSSEDIEVAKIEEIFITTQNPIVNLFERFNQIPVNVKEYYAKQNEEPQHNSDNNSGINQILATLARGEAEENISGDQEEVKFENILDTTETLTANLNDNTEQTLQESLDQTSALNLATELLNNGVIYMKNSPNLENSTARATKDSTLSETLDKTLEDPQLSNDDTSKNIEETSELSKHFDKILENSQKSAKELEKEEEESDKMENIFITSKIPTEVLNNNFTEISRDSKHSNTVSSDEVIEPEVGQDILQIAAKLIDEEDKIIDLNANSEIQISEEPNKQILNNKSENVKTDMEKLQVTTESQHNEGVEKNYGIISALDNSQYKKNGTGENMQPLIELEGKNLEGEQLVESPYEMVTKFPTILSEQTTNLEATIKELIKETLTFADKSIDLDQSTSNPKDTKESQEEKEVSLTQYNKPTELSTTETKTEDSTIFKTEIQTKDSLLSETNTEINSNSPQNNKQMDLTTFATLSQPDTNQFITTHPSINTEETTYNVPSKFEHELNMAVKSLEATTHQHFEQFQQNLQNAYKSFTQWEEEHMNQEETTNNNIMTTTPSSQDDTTESTEETVVPPSHREIKESTTSIKPIEDISSETNNNDREEIPNLGVINENFIDKYQENVQEVLTTMAAITKNHEESSTSAPLIISKSEDENFPETTITPIILTTMTTLAEEDKSSQREFSQLRVLETAASTESATLRNAISEDHSTDEANDHHVTTIEAEKITTENNVETTIVPLLTTVKLEKDINRVSLVRYDNDSSEEDVVEEHFLNTNKAAAAAANNNITHQQQANEEYVEQVHEALENNDDKITTLNSVQETTQTIKNKEEKILPSTTETFLQDMVTFIQHPDTTTFKQDESAQTQLPLTQASFMEEQQQQIESTSENNVQTATTATGEHNFETKIDKEITTTTTTTIGETVAPTTEVYSTTIVEAEIDTTTTTTPAPIQIEAEVRSRALPPPKLEYLQNEDGVEVFYGYSTVKRN